MEDGGHITYLRLPTRSPPSPLFSHLLLTIRARDVCIHTCTYVCADAYSIDTYWRQLGYSLNVEGRVNLDPWILVLVVE